MNRLSWDEYFFNIMQSVAGRATCDRGRSGAVIVKNRQILATGYVGSPKGLDHCAKQQNTGWLLMELHCIAK